jgi:protease PrsW
MSPPFVSNSNDKNARKGGALKHFLISLGILALVVMGSKGISQIVPHGPRAVLEGARASMDWPLVKKEYRKLIDSDFKNLENHRGYLEAHFAVPKSQRARRRTVTRDDNPIQEEYRGLTKSDDPATRDIGFYGLGFSFLRTNQPQLALENLNKIADKKTPFVNNTIGYVYLYGLRLPDMARDYFYKEISIKGNVQGAVSNLALMYLENKKLVELRGLKEDKELGTLVPRNILRYLALAEGKPIDYCVALYESESEHLSWEPLITSLLIALMFLIYIYFIDVFEKEKLTLLSGIFAMGLLSATLCTHLYDLAGFFGHFHQTGQDLHDLWFYIFGVGLIEETCKILPVLIVVFWMGRWSEPVDILIYGSVSALGFACLENASYFHRVAIGLIMGRTLSAVVMHICLTSLAAYGIFYARQKKRENGFLYIVGFFLAAVVIHGLYDFFISASWGLGILSTVILIYMMMAFRRMIENALGQSPFMKSGSQTAHLNYYLFYGILFVLSMQFVILAVRYDFGLAFKNMGMNFLHFYVLAIFLVTGLGRMEIVKNKWRPLLDRSVWASKKKKAGQ